MIGDHSALELILQASLIVQFVMALLVGASVVSWAIIFRKRTLLNTERLAADRFEEQFWSGGDLAALYKSLEAGSPSGMAVSRRRRSTV
jgi:biopolymer transport protein TolQ